MDLFAALGTGVIDLIQLLMPAKVLTPVLKPVVRLILGVIVVPIFRLFLHRVVRKELDAELEKDISQWLRGSLLLLIATKNMESLFFGWVPLEFREEKDWLIAIPRLLLAIGVIDAMPDQALFSIIYPGPPLFKPRKGYFWSDLRSHIWPTCRGIFSQHLTRSSAVFVILTVINDGRLGWICYGLASINYLIIGLMASRDKALNVLSKFDAAVREQRRELELELLKHDQQADEMPQPAVQSSVP